MGYSGKNKKFLLRLHSRHGLWAIAETATRRLRTPRSSSAGLLIAEYYSGDFCLIQEKSTKFEDDLSADWVRGLADHLFDLFHGLGSWLLRRKMRQIFHNPFDKTTKRT